MKKFYILLVISATLLFICSICFLSLLSFGSNVKKEETKITMGNTYKKDDKFAYSYNNMLPFGLKIKGVDINSFIVFTDTDEDYAKDKNAVYYLGKKIKSADTNTFIIVGGKNTYYGMDKNYIYYYGKPLSYIDVDSWEFIADGYSKDKRTVFYEDTILDDANPLTFMIYDKLKSPDKFIRSPIYSDSTHYYLNGKEVDVTELIKKDT